MLNIFGLHLPTRSGDVDLHTTAEDNQFRGTTFWIFGEEQEAVQRRIRIAGVKRHKSIVAGLVPKWRSKKPKKPSEPISYDSIE